MIIAEKMFPEYGRDELFSRRQNVLPSMPASKRLGSKSPEKTNSTEAEVPGAKSAEAFRREISIAVMAVEGAYG